jgi:hypothetical protein
MRAIYEQILARCRASGALLRIAEQEIGSGAIDARAACARTAGGGGQSRRRKRSGWRRTRTLRA